jgi:hypothetical protein
MTKHSIRRVAPRPEDDSHDNFCLIPSKEEKEARENSHKTGLKWFVTIVSALLLAISTIYRLKQNLEADRTLSAIFAFVAGLPWGANIIDYFKKK